LTIKVAYIVAVQQEMSMLIQACNVQQTTVVYEPVL